MKAFLNFLGSLLFMIHLVCGLKAGLCLSSNAKLKIGGILSLLSKVRLSFGEDFRQESAFYGSHQAEDNKLLTMLLYDRLELHMYT